MVREHSIRLIGQNPDIAELVSEGEIHALEYGPADLGGPGVITFYKLLDHVLLKEVYENAKKTRKDPSSFRSLSDNGH